MVNNSANMVHDHLRETVLTILDETFETVHGVFLDPETSMFETLATISSDEASRPISATCASLAAQVEHVRFYLDVTIAYAKGHPPTEKVDWSEIWRTVQSVTPAEWEASKKRLRESYQQLVTLVKQIETWDSENMVQGVLGILVHTAYHLGEIRQALCTLKN